MQSAADFLNMKYDRLWRLLTIVLLGLFVQGCSSPTVLQSQWTNRYCACTPIDSVMVIVVSENEVMRRNIEDALVQDLRAHNVKALQSYRYLSLAQLKDEQTIKNITSTYNVHNIMSIKVTGRDKETYYQPATVMVAPSWGWNNYYGYYNGLWGASYTYVAPSMYVVSYIYSDVVLFNMQVNKLVWSANLKTTINGNSAQDVVSQLGHLITQSMATEGVIMSVPSA